MYFKAFKEFIISTFQDSRIPVRDKKLLVGLFTGIILRILFIPDWIPYFGILDVLILLALILDYFFSYIDQSILLSHYPWGLKSFARIKRFSLFLSFFAPTFIKHNIWEYTKDPF